jgi:hypothetical protein
MNTHEILESVARRENLKLNGGLKKVIGLMQRADRVWVDTGDGVGCVGTISQVDEENSSVVVGLGAWGAREASHITMDITEFLQLQKESIDKKNEEFTRLAPEYTLRLQEMLERNNGEYPEQGMDAKVSPSREDFILMDELQQFFEIDGEYITSFEVADGQDRSKNKFKRLSDNTFLLRTSWDEYGMSYFKFSFLDREKATELLQAAVDKRTKEIYNLQSKNEEAEALMESFK